MPTYVDITDAEVAAESPVTVSLMTRLRDNALAYLGAPAGTVLIAYQPTAPLGWVKRTDNHDKALMVVNDATGGEAGGVHAFSTVFAKTSTDPFTLTQGYLPSLNFPVTGSLSAAANANYLTRFPSGSSIGKLGDNAGPGGQLYEISGVSATIVSVVAASGGANAAHAHPMDIRVQYNKVIFVQKS